MNMDSRNHCFIKYLTSAQALTLRPKWSHILELRYGLSGERPHKLTEIGEKYGLSRERIRQIVNDALKEIRTIGREKIQNGQKDDPCAQLILYLEEAIQPNAPGHIDRLTTLIIDELPYLPTNTYALFLIIHLICPNEYIAKRYQEKAKDRFRELHFANIKEYKREKRLKKFDQLLSYVIWPSEVSLLTQEQIRRALAKQRDYRKRDVSRDGKGKAGCYFSQKMSKEVQYESQLELDFLMRLEELEEVIFYQEQPFAISYKEGEKENSYYPDVFVLLKDGRGIVVEIKPVFRMALHKNLVKWSALRRFCNEMGIGILVTDGRHAIQQIQQQAINRSFAKAVSESLQHGPLSWKEYKEIKGKYNVNRNDFLALVLRKRLVWELNPFRLSKPSISREDSS